MGDLYMSMYDLTYLPGVVYFEVLRWGTFALSYCHLTRLRFEIQTRQQSQIYKNTKVTGVCDLFFTSNDYKGFSQWPVGTIASCIPSIGVEFMPLAMLPHHLAACRANRRSFCFFWSILADRTRSEIFVEENWKFAQGGT